MLQRRSCLLLGLAALVLSSLLGEAAAGDKLKVLLMGGRFTTWATGKRRSTTRSSSASWSAAFYWAAGREPKDP
jgi:hypothetical protein